MDAFQLGNKFLYGEVGFRDFLGSRAASLEIQALFCDGQEVPLPPQGVEGICIVNIPSFAGGVMLWGDAEPQQQHVMLPHEPHHYTNPLHHHSRMTSFSRGISSDSSSSAMEVDRQWRRHCHTHKRRRGAAAGGAAPAAAKASRADFCTAASAPPSPGQQRAAAAAQLAAGAPPQPPLQRDDGEQCAARTPQATPRDKEMRSRSDGWTQEEEATLSVHRQCFLFVGLAKAVRLCQGRSVCLHVRGSLPLQVDGEPQLLEGSCRIVITHKGGKGKGGPCIPSSSRVATTASVVEFGDGAFVPVLHAQKPAILIVLNRARDRRVISKLQCAQLLNDFQRTLG
ncbi:diacylglycerol [Cyclospora cayetanensis]|uniref:Diacylglycerol n=1 Tax=Cyclospora cayetanensis TaxID=88456 RepID=A0A1D3D3S6_9EIME|nr:diacylglycerol [Cyclospora cayetanensis]